MQYFTSAHLVLTTQCNLRCPYCYIHKYNKVMTKPMIKSVIDYLIKSAKVLNQQGIRLTMFGGEPTLYPELCEYALLYATNQCRKTQLKLHYRIITNGMRFDERIQNFFYLWRTITNGNMDVLVSLDGKPEVQRINRIPAADANFDSGDMMEENLSKMRDWCFENDLTFNRIFRTHNMLTKTSLPYLFETYKYFIEQGLSASPQLVVEEPWSEEDIAIYDSQMNQLFEYIKVKNPQLFKTQFFGYMGPKRGFEAPQNPFHCAHPGQARAVTPDGDVYTCHRAIYNFDTCIIGHIDENGNYTHNADNLKNYMNVKPCDKCQGCESAGSCHVCRNYYVDGNNFGEPWTEIDIYCKLMEVEKKYSLMAQEYLKEHNML